MLQILIILKMIQTLINISNVNNSSGVTFADNSAKVDNSTEDINGDNCQMLGI